MVQTSDKRQIQHFRRRRDRARRRAYAGGAPPIPKLQKVEGINVGLVLLRQVYQHLSPDQYAPPRDGSLRLGATTVTTTTGILFPQGVLPKRNPKEPKNLKNKEQKNRIMPRKKLPA